MLHIRPILSTLRRHKITALLLVVEIALTCAIVCNAVFLVRQRLDWIHTPSGVDEASVVQVRPVNVGIEVPDAHARATEAAAALRAIPGVRQVSLVNQIPFGMESWNSGLRLDHDAKAPIMNATTYFGDHVLETLGAQLVAGRDFQPGEYAWFDDVTSEKPGVVMPSVAIVTEAVATKMFQGNALGKSFWYGDTLLRVVGVVRNVVRPSVNDQAAPYGSIFMPVHMVEGLGTSYLLRTTPDQAAGVITAAVSTLRKIDPSRVIIEKRPFAEVRAAFFASDRAMSSLLVGVCVALLTVTALGIVGLASFWVSQRRRQIGVRRALGATRGDVLRYFQTENFLLASMGIGVGMALAYGINVVLMVNYELPRLPWGYLPVGAAVLWLLGQAAVYWPARRASRVPPVEATRGT